MNEDINDPRYKEEENRKDQDRGFRLPSFIENRIKRSAKKKAEKEIVKRIAFQAAKQGAMALARTPIGWIIAGIILFIIIIILLFFKPPGDTSPDENTQPEVGTPGGPTLPPIPGFNLSLVGPESRDNGQTIEYSITYTYNPPANSDIELEDIVIYKNIPEDTTLVNASGEYTSSSGVISWDLSRSTNQTTLTITLRPTRNDIFVTSKAFARVSGSTSSGGFSSNACTQQFEGTGHCSVENLLPYFGGDESKALIASMVCQRESGSNPMELNNNCSTNDYSVGLFQINLVAHCPGAYSDLNCNNLSNIGARNVCEQNMQNADQNIQEALRISSSGADWTPWGVWPFVQADLASCNISI